MRYYSSTPKEMFFCLWRNRELIKASTKREIQGRYKGSILGLIWSLFNPLFMLAVYTFVFSQVFSAKWNVVNESKAEFALILFIGLIVFNFFAECINKAPNIIIYNPNYVKKVVFPLEIIPFVNLLAALYHATISLLVWFAAYLIMNGIPSFTILFFPTVLLPFIFFTMGLSWAISSLGVFLRDVSQLLTLIVTMLMFLSPIFYPVNALPENYQKILFLNPLTPVIEMMRNILYWREYPNFQVLILYWIASFFIAWGGFIWFQKTRKGFADVI